MVHQQQVRSVDNQLPRDQAEEAVQDQALPRELAIRKALLGHPLLVEEELDHEPGLEPPHSGQVVKRLHAHLPFKKGTD